MTQENRPRGFRESYFQDHSRKIILGEDGKSRVEYVYEGIYYTLDGSDACWKKGKLRCLLLTAAGASCLLSAMVTQTAGNHIRALELLQAVSLLLFFGAGIGVFGRLTAPRNMTRWEYKMGVSTLKEFTLLVLLGLALLLAAEAYTALRGSFPVDMAAIGLWGKLMLSFFLMWFQFRLLGKERYLQQRSDDLPHGIDITNDFAAMP